MSEVKAEISDIKGSRGAFSSTPLYIATAPSLTSAAGVIILPLLVRWRGKA